MIERALDSMGWPASLAAAGGLVVHAEGTRNQAAERQGRASDSVDLVPFSETLAIDPLGDRLAREYRYDRYDGTFEWLRDLYEGSQDRKVLVLQDRFAIWLRSPEHAEGRRRYERRVPHLLLQEVLDRPDDLRLIESTAAGPVVEGALSDGTLVQLFFEAEDPVLARIEYRLDVQSFGDALLTWSFDDWSPLDGVGRFPRRLKAGVEGRPFLDLVVTQARTGGRAVATLFEPPDGIELPEEPRVLPPAADASADAEVRQEAAGVYTVRNLRGGFHPMFVELGDCVLAIDAPAGYRLLEELPAGDVASGPSSAWLSERYLGLIHETLPGKRVCWVVITHFHNDHAGGLRAFVAEGAQLLVSPGDREAVEELLDDPHALAPDRQSSVARAAATEAVESRRTLTGGGRRVDVVQMGANAHTDEMLYAYLPEEGFVYVSDLLTPAPLEAFPTPSHAALDRRFVQWLDAAGLDPQRIYTMHGSGLASREHLEILRRLTPEPRLEIVRPDRPLDAAVSPLPHVEPHLAIAPDDERHLVVGSIVVPSDRGPGWRCAAFTSRDGGGNWSRHDFEIDRCIDPWVLITASGEALLAAIEIGSGRPAEDRFRLLLFRSSDGGRGWSETPIDLGPSHDHQILLEEPGGDLLLVSRRALRTRAGRLRHSVSFMRSRDRGGSFEAISLTRPSNLALNPTGLARLKDDALIVSFLDFQRNVDGFSRGGILRQPRAWALRSDDGGRSFTEPSFVSEACGPTRGFAGYPALAVDASASRDRLLHLCVRAGFAGLALTFSEDGGETWSNPRRIDAPPATGDAHARTPMLAVNRQGVVAAAWYDRRDDPDHRCQDLYFTASNDGGSSFLPPIRGSTQTSCPAVGDNGSVADSWPMGGDYGSLAAGPNGIFHVVWADSRSGRFQLRHAALRLAGRSEESAPAGR